MLYRFNLRLLFVVVFSICIWLLPQPDGVSIKAWQLLAIFFGTILSIMVHALPMGAVTLIGLVIAVLTGTVSFQQAFAGYSDPIVWLVLGAFFIAHGFVSSGLGKRIAYRLISLLGRSLLGLGYGIACGEAVLAMAIPSATARTGGILFPIVGSLVDSLGDSKAKADENSTNAFLISVAFHMSVVSSAMFLTGMAGNALIVKLAGAIGVQITWASWAVAAILPGILSIILIPYAIKLYFKPSLGDDALLLDLTKKKYGELGPMQEAEKYMAAIFFILISLWSFGAIFNISASVSVLVGIALMIITKVVSWEELLSIRSAWNTFIWFGALLALATSLNDLGLTSWFGNFVASILSEYNVFVAISGLLFVYFYSHYFFASSTAHIGAMLLPFLLVSSNLDASPVLVTMLFAFASNLFASLTHYGNGPAPILYGAGYVGLSNWWKLGFIISIINIVIWFGFGMLWWKFVGLY